MSSIGQCSNEPSVDESRRGKMKEDGRCAAHPSIQLCILHPDGPKVLLQECPLCALARPGKGGKSSRRNHRSRSPLQRSLNRSDDDFFRRSRGQSRLRQRSPFECSSEKQRSKSRARSNHRAKSRARGDHRSKSRARDDHRSKSRARGDHRSKSRAREEHRSKSRVRGDFRSKSRARGEQRSKSRARHTGRSQSRAREESRSDNSMTGCVIKVVQYTLNGEDPQNSQSCNSFYDSDENLGGYGSIQKSRGGSRRSSVDQNACQRSATTISTQSLSSHSTRRTGKDEKSETLLGTVESDGDHDSLDDDPTSAWSKFDIGIQHAQNRRFDKARTEFMKVMRCRTKMFGSTHEYLAPVYEMLGHCERGMGNHEAALSHYIAALRILDLKVKSRTEEDAPAPPQASGATNASESWALSDHEIELIATRIRLSLLENTKELESKRNGLTKESAPTTIVPAPPRRRSVEPPAERRKPKSDRQERRNQLRHSSRPRRPTKTEDDRFSRALVVPEKPDFNELWDS